MTVANNAIEFRWVSYSAESTPVNPIRRSHRDPTADAAISNIMREERRKKKQLSHVPKRNTWKAGGGGHAGK